MSGDRLGSRSAAQSRYEVVPPIEDDPSVDAATMLYRPEHFKPRRIPHGGKLIATVKDADGNIIGLSQPGTGAWKS